MDEFDNILSAWEEALNNYQAEAELYAEADADLKAYMAMSKLARMDTGSSATKAESEVMATEGWQERYTRTQKHAAYVETAKKSLALYQARFEAERTRQANARRVV